jgi:hypothetical protein
VGRFNAQNICRAFASPLMTDEQLHYWRGKGENRKLVARRSFYDAEKNYHAKIGRSQPGDNCQACYDNYSRFGESCFRAMLRETFDLYRVPLESYSD